MQTSRNCARCHAPLGENAPEGFCARCLITDLIVPGYAGETVADLPGDSAATVLRYFGDYEFVEQLSRGGMGTVFKARQVSLNRLVAVKMIFGGAANSSLLKRFHTEAEAAARLQHPHIVPIHEFGEYGGEYFLSMKLIEGARALVALNLPPREAVGQLIHIARAVHYAHQHGVLHRDIKPGNILVGDDGVPYLTDFGLAKLTGNEANVTLTQEMLGTPAYMAPEQVRGSAQAVTTAADIYGLGATLYECLAHRPPFEGRTVAELLRKIVEEVPPPLRHAARRHWLRLRKNVNPGTQPRSLLSSGPIDRDLETICFKCLEKKPSDRYSSAHALAEDLEHWRAGEPINARPVTTFERVGKWARRKPAWAALLATATLAFITIALGVSWFNWRLGQKNREAIERVIRLNIDTAGRLEADGDPSRAMLYFAEALRLAEADQKSAEVEMLRLRFHSLLRESPSLLQCWMHEGGANDAEFSPDGARVLSAGNDGNARVWDAGTGAAILDALRHNAPVLSAFFSPDGRVIATLGGDGQARLWDARDGSALSEPLPMRLPAELWRFGPRAMAFDSSSQFFAYGFSNTVHLFDLSTRNLRRGPTVSGEVMHLAFRPGSAELAVGTARAVELWNLNASVPAKVLARGQRARWVGFSPDGHRLLALVAYVEARIWDADSGDLQLELNNPGTAPILDLGLSSDGRRISTANFASSVRVWDALTGRSISSFEVVAPVGVMHFGDDDQIATASLDGGLRFWDRAGAKLAPVLWHGGAVTSAAIDASGQRLVAACQDGSVRLWALPRLKPRPTEFERWERVSLCAVSADGETQLSYFGGNGVHLWEASQNKHLATIQSPDPVTFAALSPDGRSVATLSWLPGLKANLAVWNRDATLRFQLPQAVDDRSRFYHADFSPDGAQLGIGFSRPDGSGGAQILDVLTGHPISPTLDHRGPVRFVHFDPQGSRLVTAGDDGIAQAWDVRTGRTLSPPLKHDGPLSVARFGPDGQSLITACYDETFLPRYAQVWNGHDFSPRTPRLWHLDGILDAVFSPDGRKVATSGEDRVVMLWDAFSGVPLTPPLQQPEKADHVTFSPDGRLLLVSCRSSYLRVFHAATGEQITAQIPYGASMTVAHFASDSSAVIFAGSNGHPITVPFAASVLPVDQLRRTAELLSNHKLSRLGLERLNVRELSEAWQADKNESRRNE